MKKIFYVCCIILLSVSCKTTQKTGGEAGYGSPRVKQELVNDQMFLIKKIARDKTYGYTEKNPIMVGGGLSEGALNQRRFLNALLGPNGEPVIYQRLGSCCPFYTKNGIFGDSGLLDRYEITFIGTKTPPIVLYINMYDSDVLQVPVGFTLRK